MSSKKECAVLGYGVTGHLAAAERTVLTAAALIATVLTVLVVVAGLATVTGAML